MDYLEKAVIRRPKIPLWSLALASTSELIRLNRSMIREGSLTKTTLTTGDTNFLLVANTLM